MIENLQKIVTEYKEPNTELLYKMLESMTITELLNDVRVVQAMRNIRIEDFITEEMIESFIPPEKKLRGGNIDTNDVKTVLNELFERYYKNQPLPFYFDPKLSRSTGAPHMIAIIAQLLDIEENDKILILGSKSGYLESVIQDIEKGTQVYVIEKVPEIYSITKSNLDRINAGIKIYLGDPIYSINELPISQFDKILVTGFMKEVPKQVFDYLKIGGILCAPVGSFYEQDFLRYFKASKNSTDEETHLRVMFSRLITSYQ
ncbi:MAG: hypothetical protein JW776_06445 [Candidatus Lokiarchaeota archaeon]|nr:hypothetical protein [Candidatus Lokiarchaeota archaeon]